MKTHSSSPTAPNERGRVRLICISFALLTGLVFGQTLGHEFVNYDDNVYVYENSAVSEGVTWNGIARAFTEGQARNWHPLTTLSHMLDCQLFGLTPRGHHLSNVLLHAAAVVLLFVVLRNLTGALWRSAFVAAVFAIHPLRVESVAWVAERKDVLSAVFFFLALGAYARYARRPSVARYLLVLFTFACGLMSKPMLVTLPFVLLLLDDWPLGRFAAVATEVRSTTLRLLLEKIPLLALSVASAAVTFLVQKRVGFQAEDLPLVWRINNALVACITYIWQMIWPAELAVFYPHPYDRLAIWQVIGAAALLIGFTALVLLWRRARPYLNTGWFWYLGMLVPVIGIVEVGSQASADRYTYLPQIGLYICVAWCAAELWPRGRYRGQLLGAGAAVLIAVLSWSAWRQTAYWRTSEALWKRALEVTSKNDIAHLNLGDVLFKRGELDNALSHYEKALAIRSGRHRSGYDFPLAVIHSSLGSALHRKGQSEQAIEQFQKAIQLQPDYAQAYLNLGATLAEKSRLDEAIAAVRQGVAAQPENAEGRISLATLLLGKGMEEEAIAQYEEALQTAPRAVAALNNLAWLYTTSGKPSVRDGDRAVLLAERAVRVSDGKDPFLLHKLAAAYAETARFPEALETAQRGLELAIGQNNSGLADELKRNITLYRKNSALTVRPAR